MLETKYWVNSNTGDVIIKHGEQYQLILISRLQDGKILPSEIVNITPTQFSTIKGFVPIKKKKLKYSHFNKYAPTLPDGSKGESKRVNIPTISQSRQDILKNIGINL